MVHRELKTSQAWKAHATELSDWCLKNLVRRKDIYGGYYQKDEVKITTVKKNHWTWKPLETALQNHFHAHACNDTIGLYPCNLQNICSWGCIDVDCHKDNPDMAQNNLCRVVRYEQHLLQAGLTCFVTGENPGNFHVWVLVKECAAADLKYLLKQLVEKDSKDEVFPKQDRVSVEHPGNFARLFGRHPKTGLWSHVWLQGVQLTTEDSIQHILRQQPTQVEIPSINYQPSSKNLSNTQLVNSTFNHITSNKIITALTPCLYTNPYLLPGSDLYDAIEYAAPTETGVRNQQLLKLCQVLKSFEVPTDQISNCFDLWWRSAKHQVATTEKETSWKEFQEIWKRSTFKKLDYAALREQVSFVVLPKNNLSNTKNLLLKVCHLLANHQNEFYLSVTEASKVLQLTRKAAYNHLESLVEQSYLKILKVGNKRERKATEYRLLSPPNSSEFHLDTK